MKFDIGPAFLGQVQVDPGGRNVDKLPGMVESQVVVRLFLEFSELFFIVAFDPARRSNVDGFELAFDLVLITQSCRNDIELQRPDGPEYQVIVAQRPEQLRRALFAQLCKAFLQGF